MRNAVPPQDAAADLNEAVRLHRLGSLDEAELLYRAVLARFPVHPDALLNLGLIYKARGMFENALGLWRMAAVNNPDHGGAPLASGKVLSMLGRLPEALAGFQQALRIAPTDVDALNCRGNVLARLGRHLDALASYDQALGHQPDYGLALINRGNVLGYLRRPEEAVESYRAGLRLHPDSVEALGQLLHQQLQVCDWLDYDQTSTLIAQRIGRGESADLPFGFLSHSDDPAAQLACAQVHARARFPVRPAPLWTGDAYRHDRIRVAYVSADFRNHAVAHLIAGLFELHDKGRFELSGYALGPSVEDPVRARIRAAFPIFHDVARLSDLEVAQMIRAAEIDIVVDLTGLTTHCRPGIFAHRPAPLQFNYLGHPGTVGADFFDYILADGHVIPPGAERFYSEQVIRLPHSYQVNDHSRVVPPETPTRVEAGLPDDAFVFACFNATYKLNPQVFDTWMRLLSKVPGSVMWLLESHPAVVRNLRAEAQERGVSGDRLVFAPKVTPEDHLARHRLADLFLDTLPYNAHTTASDALWTGLPIVTCAGQGFAARVAASLLNAVGLPELITESLEAYEALALDLATHPERLADLKARLAARIKDAPLFDTDLSRRHIEAAYTAAWERQQRGEPPAAFNVES